MTGGLVSKVIAYDYANRPTSVTFAGATTTYAYGLWGQSEPMFGKENLYIPNRVGGRKHP